eukprot:TRINITY_DN5665_c0_g1_i1.p2 TRINITY_DN5665_c0_g1~~TRINITY_DN5665_c0_g1_i1.p2  ORF type:complete len:102 (-),score=30.78 TRINITY_DN5665_c0_g1_i1:115-387(-)
MGIITIVFDAWLISTGFAGLRRIAGLDLFKYISPTVSRFPLIQSCVRGYFNVGEITIQKTSNMLSNLKTKPIDRSKIESAKFDNKHDSTH